MSLILSVLMFYHVIDDILLILSVLMFDHIIDDIRLDVDNSNNSRSHVVPGACLEPSHQIYKMKHLQKQLTDEPELFSPNALS